MAKPETPHVIGVDMGGTNVQVAVVDAKNNIIGRAKKKTRADKGADEVVQRIIKTVEAGLSDAGMSGNDISALCIGAPGPLDPSTGVVLSAPNLGWDNVPLKQLMEDALGIRTQLENDVNVGTYGEFRLGAGRDVQTLVGIFVGTGIGGGLVINGELFRGLNYTAGEIGHMVVELRGPLCGCGNRGCLEAIAGRAGMVRELQYQIDRGRKSLVTQLTDGDLTKARSRVFAEAYGKGDPLTVEVVTRSIEALGVAIGNVIDLLSPEAVVLGGGVTDALGQPYVNTVREATERNCFAEARRGVKIVAAGLGDDAGVLGAAQLARESL